MRDIYYDDKAESQRLEHMFFIRKIADILQNTGKNKEKCFKNPLAFFCDYDYTNGGGAKWSKGV
ncbi:MAG: hypothetical protein GX257_06370 [Clostridiales bacterium]|nr:hypothetical protein [Clostridiales bacterium]